MRSPAGPRAKYRAVKVWACRSCCCPASPVKGTAKGERDCQNCGAARSISCFASKAEFRRWFELRALERIGAIRDLEYQPRYPVVINGKKIFVWTADAKYFDKEKLVVEDTKGVETQATKLRREVAEAVYGIKVTLIGGRRM